MHSGETDAGSPGIVLVSGNENVVFDAEPTFGQWVDFAFELKADGSYDFFIGDSFILSSDPGLLDYSAGTDVRLVVAGRSVGTTAMMDNIAVSVPAPGTASLLAMALCTRRRRRRSRR